MSECLLLNPELGIGHGKECCCNCFNHYRADVCNCFDEWPDILIIERSCLNNNHGLIGWACTAGMCDGRTVDISRKEHGGCELWIGRLLRRGDDHETTESLRLDDL
ncbi:MAG TPA: hypothetical protein ACFYD4_12700 [Candidatus Wunengus sp. YC61]|uniref:hypothetical protein n=1 Tax=Candidatus Wunengus sp. YC61 TaxID=3367698 RepID=UPI00402664D6